MKLLKSKILIFTIILFSAILTFDIAIRIWFSNTYHRTINPDFSTINDVSTPIIGILSLAVYGYALFVPIKQNRILVSQNFRSYFEGEIEKTERVLNNKSDNIVLEGNKYAPIDLFDLLKVIE